MLLNQYQASTKQLNQGFDSESAFTVSSVTFLDLFERENVEFISIITLGIWNTCIAFILWLWGLSRIPDIARGNYLFFLKPVIALGLAYFIWRNRCKDEIYILRVCSAEGELARNLQATTTMAPRENANSNPNSSMR